MARKALVVGIDFYSDIDELSGCVDDAESVQRVLERHGDGRPNFDVKLLTAPHGKIVGKAELKRHIQDLFGAAHEVALLYFAGHGYVETTGGYLLTSESRTGDDGLPLADILLWANQSKSENRVIVLDSCYSGAAGTRPPRTDTAELSQGMTILTSSLDDEGAAEAGGKGVFTRLFVDALTGAAANLVGDISPGSVYAHIDQSLGAWEQRPVFRTNVKNFVALREVEPPIRREDLRKIATFFPPPKNEFALDPSFEPDSGHAVEANTDIFAVLQKMNRVNLVVPVGTPHMYYAAMESRSCRLTRLGEHYRRLAKLGRI